MATQPITGRGLLLVTSSISSPLLSEEAYIKWYEEDHIAEIMQTSSIYSALRYKSIDPSAPKPYLVTYPMEDIAFTQSEEFKAIKVHSELLPNGGPIYDLADLEVRYYGLVQVFEPSGKVEKGSLKMIITAGIEPGDETSEQEFDDWYRKEHLIDVSKVTGFLRSTRFKLLYHRTNAQSRALKGLPPTDADLTAKEPPTYLAIHEFEVERPDGEALKKTAETEWAKKILGGAKTMEVGMWGLKGRFGDGKFF